IVIIDGPAEDARAHFSRVRQWVGGTYTVQGPQGPAKVAIDLSIGIAEWRGGFTAAGMIEEAERRGYTTKHLRRRRPPFSGARRVGSGGLGGSGLGGSGRESRARGSGLGGSGRKKGGAPCGTPPSFFST